MEIQKGWTRSPDDDVDIFDLAAAGNHGKGW